MQERNEIRRLYHIEGKSLRAIARETGFHRDTVKRIVAEGGPPQYRRREAPQRPVLGPFIPIIDEMLKQDGQAPPKQRHTAKRIFDRLCGEHDYTGGYTQVRAYVRQACAVRQEAFVPLEFGPAVAQVDWGEAVAYDATHEPPDHASVRSRKVYVFVMTLPFSDARFVAAFPRQTQEFFFEGHRQAFEFFGGVPRRIVYDNLSSAVTKVLRGRSRRLNTTFQQFCEHYLFEPAFCNVARGNEKGHVENGVKWTQRNLFVPPPRFSDWDHLNASLAEGCRNLWSRRVRGHEQTIGERLNEERHHLTPRPGQPDAKKPLKPQRVSSLCLVRFSTNDYSTPCQYAHHCVVVRPTVGNVRIYHDDRLIAAHKRSYGRHQAIYEPWHYLALIERKPRALDDGAPMKRLELDPCFDVLRRRLEAGQIHSRGTREYIQVLRLLEHHSLSDVTRAVQRALALGVDHHEAIKNLVLCPPERVPSPLDLTGRNWLAAYRFVPAPIAPYGALVGQGGGA
jgi:transposase